MSETIFASVARWRSLLSAPPESFIREIARLRNEEPCEAKQAIDHYGSLLDQAVARFGRADEDSVAIVRAPGRVNLLGTHIDHRGGRVNPIAVRELVSIVFPREDGTVRLANADPEFSDAEFQISALLPDGSQDDWADWTLQTPAYLEAEGVLGDWSTYPRAAAAYFANKWGDPAACAATTHTWIRSFPRPPDSPARRRWWSAVRSSSTR